ncbi:MAG: glycosyl transferase family protein [Gammaproteobacteria bacterium]|nr:MAG: glycosyl transferase family protein [Gammaproteobacteria bacterium]TND05848.1 MAG: glycosyl transferase family protein [Gammaproteobacteria bacterium]
MKFWCKSGGWASRKAIRTLAGMTPADVRSVAVIRHAAMGDLVQVRPFLIETRRYFPNAGITLSLCSNYVRGAPDELADRIHVVYGSDRKDVAVSAQLRRARELGYHDLVFDLAATPRSFYLCLLTRAKLKIGFPYKAIQGRLFYDATVPRSDLRYETENMLDMLALLGHRWQYPPVFNMPGEPVVRDRPFIIYFPSASTPVKCWPHGHFAELITGMAAQYPDYEHIVLEGIAAWESVADIMDKTQHLANVTALKLDDLDGTVALVKGASLVVANDTGIRNFAMACNVPTVGIFFVTPVFRYWPRYGHHDVVFTPDGGVPDVDSVFAAARAMLAVRD